MDWHECTFKKLIKETSLDKGLINSLIRSSNNKIYSNSKLKLEDNTASTKIGIVYDSLRELLEALAIKKGFKIYNHECFSAFLREICDMPNYALEFDRFRKIRNRINYYGNVVLRDEARQIIKDISLLRVSILRDYFREVK